MTSTSTSYCAVSGVCAGPTHRAELLVLVIAAVVVVAAIASRVGVGALLVEQVRVLAGKLEGVLDRCRREHGRETERTLARIAGELGLRK